MKGPEELKGSLSREAAPCVPFRKLGNQEAAAGTFEFKSEPHSHDPGLRKAVLPSLQCVLTSVKTVTGI